MATVSAICLCGSNQLSTARCGRCVKPVCEACKVVTETGVYCSRACAEVAGTYAASLNAERSIPRSRPSGIVGTLGMLSSLAVVGYLIYWLVFNGPSPSMLLSRFGF